MQDRLAPGGHFLWIDENADALRKVRSGEIVVSPAIHPEPHRVPNGLIHDWIGAAFLPEVTAQEMLSVLRDYSHYKDFYRPYIVDSKTEALGASEDRFSVVVRNKAVILKTAIAGEYRSTTHTAGPHRWYSYSQSTHLQDIEDFGTPQQHSLPEGKDGLLWRLFSITRYEERDGGLYIEIEAMALSRDIPAALRWMIDPIVRKVSKNSLLVSLKQTGDAVRARAVVANRAADSGLKR